MFIVPPARILVLPRECTINFKVNFLGNRLWQPRKLTTREQSKKAFKETAINSAIKVLIADTGGHYSRRFAAVALTLHRSQK